MTKPKPLYCVTFGSPSYRRVRLGRWAWAVRDGMTGPVLAEGHTLTERGAHRAIERTVRRCVPISGDCRCDRPVLHRLTPAEAAALNARLEAERVPVTVRIDNPAADVVLWPALELTTEQQVHAMRLVCDRTDAPVRWAGVA